MWLRSFNLSTLVPHFYPFFITASTVIVLYTQLIIPSHQAVYPFILPLVRLIVSVTYRSTNETV